MVINFFTIGDSRNIEVWSNVPYYIAKKLEGKGIILNRINLEPNKYFQLIYKLVWGFWANKLFGIFKIRRDNTYQNSLFNYYLTRLKILYYSHKYNDANLNFFLTYQFSSCDISLTPYVLLHDKTYEEFLATQNATIPNNSKFIIRREINNIKGASLIYSTNTHSFNFIQSKYRKDNVRLIKGYMNLEEEEFDVKEIINVKKKSNNILFVDGTWDGRGGDELLEIYEMINKISENKLNLIIVGDNNLTPDYIKLKNIKVYNYLSKKNKKELNIYRNLLYEAKLFVMPMRRGPIPAVFIEANYYYTPVITTNIWNAEQMIENGTNGFLIEKLDVKLFVEKILELINNEEKYITLAVNSHKYVAENFRWEIFIDNFVDECKKFY